MSEDLGHDFNWNGFTYVCGKCGKTERSASGYGEQIMPCRPGAPDCSRCGDSGWLPEIEGRDGSYITSRPCKCAAGDRVSRLQS